MIIFRRFQDLPSGCGTYEILDDETRKATAGGSIRCDRVSSPACSPDWKGANWYRIMPPAGTQMPEAPTKAFRCGSKSTGWILGKHPKNKGETVEAKVCVSWGHACRWSMKTSIRNCGSFFLYKLPEPSNCTFRFCTV